MSRSRVADRAGKIYDFLKANINTLYTFDDLCRALGLQDGSTTRAAIRRARGLAEEDDLCFPVACWDNGLTYCVTDDPNAVVDSSLHLGSIANGVGVRKDIHDAFIASRMAKLAPTDRAIVHSIDRFEAAHREQRKAYTEIIKMAREMRRASE